MLETLTATVMFFALVAAWMVLPASPRLSTDVPASHLEPVAA